MKKSLNTLMMIFVLSSIYVFGINLISSIRVPLEQNQSNGSIIEDPSIQKISVGDQISVKVVRHRWYGTIENDKLRLFNLFYLPLGDYVLSHILFLVVLTFLALYINKREVKNQDGKMG